jgi:hypothetical protein
MIFFQSEAGAAGPAAQPNVTSGFLDHELTIARKAQCRIFFFIP